MDNFTCRSCGFKHRRMSVAATKKVKMEQISCPKCSKVATRKAKQSNSNYAKKLSKEKPASEQLTPEHYEELHAIFMAHDYDGSGDVDRTEFAAMWNILGGNPTSAELQKRLETVDENSDGCLDFEEFCVLIWPTLVDEGSSAAEQVMTENIAKALKSLDTNRDGVINRKELEKMLTQGGSDVMTKAEVEEVLRLFEDNGIKKMTPEVLALFLMGH